MSLPRGKLVVFTGPSGSGKSSLAFDTIFAEGSAAICRVPCPPMPEAVPRARWTSPMSSFIEVALTGRLDRAKIHQPQSPRSTVGTVTEVCRLSAACSGPASACRTARSVARSLRAQTPQQIVDRVLELQEGTRFQRVGSGGALVARGSYVLDLLRELRHQGLRRARASTGTVIMDLNDPTSKLEKIRAARHRRRGRSTGGHEGRAQRQRLTDSASRLALELSGEASSCSTSSTWPRTTRERERKFSEKLRLPQRVRHPARD